MKISLPIKLGAYALIVLISAGFAYNYYTEVTEAQRTVIKLAYDPNASSPLQPGVVIDKAVLDQMKNVELPEDIANGQLGWALTSTPANRLALEGLVISTMLQPGDFLRAEDFVRRAGDILARRVDPGSRAFSVAVNPGAAVETFLSPGSRVDVIHTSLDEEEQASSTVLLENVSLLAVGRFQSEAEYVEAGRPTYASVTVQAPVAEIQDFLNIIEALRGQVTVVLRNPCDENAEQCRDEDGGVQADE